MAEHASVQGKKRKMWYERDNPELSYPSGSNGMQNHHILPCTSVKRSLVESAQTKDNLIKGVQFFSKWNINKSDNMKMLPTIPVYARYYGKKGRKQGPVVVPANVMGSPCHDRAHPTYNDYAKTALMSVWSKVQITLDGHKLSDATDISGDLDGKVKSWAKKVAGRPTTQANWRAMCAGSPAGLAAFAMAYP